MKYEEVIKRINCFQQAKNMSSRSLSLTIGKNETYINKLKNISFSLPTKVLLEIISAFEISEIEFFATNFTTYKQDNELLSLVCNLSAEKKQNLINFIKNK